MAWACFRWRPRDPAEHPDCPPGSQDPGHPRGRPRRGLCPEHEARGGAASGTRPRAPGSLGAGDNPDSGLAGRARQVCVCLYVIRVHTRARASILTMCTYEHICLSVCDGCERTLCACM